MPLFGASLVAQQVKKKSACSAGEPSSTPRSGRFPGEGTGYPLQYSWASLVAQVVKNPPAMGDLGLIPGLGRSPGEGKGCPTPVFWPGELHGLDMLYLRRTQQISIRKLYTLKQ